MICPVEIASDLSALQAARVGDHGRHGVLHAGRSGAGWFQDERWYDLLVILDDANTEIYYAQLVEEEASVPVLAGLKEVVEHKGVFCALYRESG
jgi:hypothetical protein